MFIEYLWITIWQYLCIFIFNIIFLSLIWVYADFKFKNEKNKKRKETIWKSFDVIFTLFILLLLELSIVLIKLAVDRYLSFYTIAELIPLIHFNFL